MEFDVLIKKIKSQRPQRWWSKEESELIERCAIEGVYGTEIYEQNWLPNRSIESIECKMSRAKRKLRGVIK
jgi:hypothetical protein